MIPFQQLGPILALIPKLSDLLAAGREQRKTLFFDYIVPLHDSMEKIREDYIQVFISFRNGIKSAKSKEDIRKALDQFIKSRESIVLARAKVREALTQETIAQWNRKVEEFMWGDKFDESVEAELTKMIYYTRKFFYGEPPPEDDESDTMASQFSAEIENLLRTKDLKTRIDEHNLMLMQRTCDVLIQNMIQSWEEITKSFSRIKLYYT